MFCKYTNLEVQALLITKEKNSKEYIYWLTNNNVINFDKFRLPFFYTLYSNVLGKLAIGDFNNWVIQELLLADLEKTRYTRDDEGPYSRINLDQHGYVMRYIVILMSFQTFSSINYHGSSNHL